MNQECLCGRLYDKYKTLTIVENDDFGTKFNQEIGIRMANLTSGSKSEEKCKIKEAKLRCVSYVTGSIKLSDEKTS